jgi:hypothetical protein
MRHVHAGHLCLPCGAMRFTTSRAAPDWYPREASAAFTSAASTVPGRGHYSAHSASVQRTSGTHLGQHTMLRCQVCWSAATAAWAIRRSALTQCMATLNGRVVRQLQQQLRVPELCQPPTRLGAGRSRIAAARQLIRC